MVDLFVVPDKWSLSAMMQQSCNDATSLSESRVNSYEKQPSQNFINIPSATKVPFCFV